MLKELQRNAETESWSAIYEETFQKNLYELYTLLRSRGFKVVNLYREQIPKIALDLAKKLKPDEVRLSESIAKLGRILGWSLPAPITRIPIADMFFLTCPATTGYCSRICYAQKYNFKMHHVQMSQFKNFLASLRDDFPKIMVALLRYMENFNTVKIFRVHVSGDFYSERYIKYWRSIAEELRDWRFYTYTRIWLIPRLRSVIESELMPLNNFIIYASTDPETPAPPNNWLEATIVDRDMFWKWVEQLTTGERSRFIIWILFKDEGNDLFDRYRVKTFDNGKTWIWCREEATKILLYMRYERKLMKYFNISRKELIEMISRELKIKEPKTLDDIAPKCDLCMHCPLGKGNVVFIEH